MNVAKTGYSGPLFVAGDTTDSIEQDAWELRIVSRNSHYPQGGAPDGARSAIVDVERLDLSLSALWFAENQGTGRVVLRWISLHRDRSIGCLAGSGIVN